MTKEEALQIVTNAAEMAVGEYECACNRKREALQILIDAAEMALSDRECARNREWANSVRAAITLLQTEEE